MKSFKVRLSCPQLRFVHDVVENAASMGDCELVGFELHFSDYEGVRSVLDQIHRLPTGSTRAYVSWNAIVDKINKGIVAACEVPALRVMDHCPGRGCAL